MAILRIFSTGCIDWLAGIGIIVDSANVFTNALDSLMKELPSVTDINADSRMVPVDYQITNTTLHHKFDLDEFLAQIRSVAKTWNQKKTIGNPRILKSKNILHHTFVSFNPVEWERPNLCMNLPN
jgi:hypothetical protein